MLKRIEGNGVRTIIVETASRFARDLMVQEVGYAMLTERGIELIAADSPSPSSRIPRRRGSFGRSSAPFPSSTKP